MRQALVCGVFRGRQSAAIFNVLNRVIRKIVSKRVGAAHMMKSFDFAPPASPRLPHSLQDLENSAGLSRIFFDLRADWGTSSATQCPLLAPAALSTVTKIGQILTISLAAQPHITRENLANARFQVLFIRGDHLATIVRDAATAARDRQRDFLDVSSETKTVQALLRRLGQRVSTRPFSVSLRARLASHRRAKSRATWSPSVGGDEDARTRNRISLPAVRDSRRGVAPRRRGQAGSFSFVG
jgi:hypothetical protein